MNTRIQELLVDILKDLENTQRYIHGYGYRRTIRNILTANKDSVIAPYFREKRYYGIIKYLSLEDTENMLNQLVEDNAITCIATERGKMYCTFSYLCRTQSKLKFD